MRQHQDQNPCEQKQLLLSSKAVKFLYHEKRHVMLCSQTRDQTVLHVFEYHPRVSPMHRFPPHQRNTSGPPKSKKQPPRTKRAKKTPTKTRAAPVVFLRAQQDSSAPHLWEPLVWVILL